MLVDEVAYVVVRVVAPTTYHNLHAADTRGCSLQVADVLLIIGLRLLEDVFAVLTDGFAIGHEGAVRINMYVEEQSGCEARIAQFLDGLGAFAADMSTDIDARNEVLCYAAFSYEEQACEHEE